jgi:hypothetical protein
VTLEGFSNVNSYPDYRDLRDGTHQLRGACAMANLDAGFVDKRDALPHVPVDGAWRGGLRCIQGPARIRRNTLTLASAIDERVNLRFQFDALPTVGLYHAAQNVGARRRAC